MYLRKIEHSLNDFRFAFSEESTSVIKREYIQETELVCLFGKLVINRI